MNDFRPFLAVGFFDKFLNQLYRFVLGQNTEDFKECGLHNNVDTVAHTRFFRNLDTVDNVELRFFRDKIFLHFYRQVLPYLILIPVAVQKEGSAFFKALEHIIRFEEGEFMARNKVSLSDKVGLADLFLSKAQVRGGNRSGLLGVVHKIGLRVVVGRFTDNFDGVLVGADRTVRAESVEHSLMHTGIINMEVMVVGKAYMGYVVFDTDGKVALLFSFHIIEYGFNHCRSEFF